ncbi:MAG: ABC transporter ATP-binding protein, partial [Clostridia bacterium]|nr:ABC transporter ATP-binding protein [Clostridia bacterium]
MQNRQAPMQNKKTDGFARGPRRGGFAVPSQKAKDFKGTLKKLLRYLKPQINILVVIIFVAILSTIFSIAAPKLIASNITNPLVTAISSNGAIADWNSIIKWIIILAAIYTLSAFLSFLSHFIAVKLSQAVVYNMRKDIKAKLNKLPLKYYDNSTIGNTLSVITNDIDLISTTLQQSLTQIITSVITIIGVFIMMLTISVLLALITLLAMPAFAIFTVIIMKKSQKQFILQQKNLGDLNGHIEEIYNGQTEIKLFNKEEQCAQDFEKINKKLTAASIKAQFLSGIVFPVLRFINNISYVGVVILGGVLAGGKPPLSLGDIQAFLQYSNSFSQPILNTAQLANVLQSTVAAAERVFEILEQEEEKQSDKEENIKDNFSGKVVFENVSFSYSKEKELIKNLNLNIEKGSKIAIVGPTGAGKTTLVNLLMRFYDIDGGTIYIDGYNINGISRHALRDIFGMVLQDTWLFNGTIKENIAYGNENASMEEIIDAAKKAHIHHHIMTLKDGYDTVLSENASNISQGQKQLLTIARAILKNPKILILDEATSSVDTRTEQLIQDAMNAMTNDRTSFIIAHRLSTIKNASIILVMDKGNIIEQGSHQQLMQRKGFYYDLYS